MKAALELEEALETPQLAWLSAAMDCDYHIRSKTWNLESKQNLQVQLKNVPTQIWRLILEFWDLTSYLTWFDLWRQYQQGSILGRWISICPGPFFRSSHWEKRDFKKMALAYVLIMLLIRFRSHSPRSHCEKNMTLHYHPPILPKEMTDVSVMVCHINNPTDFCLQLVSMHIVFETKYFCKF